MDIRHLSIAVEAVILFLCITVLTGCEDEKKPATPENPEEETPFSIKVYDISAVSATVEVEPLDKNTPYYMDIINVSNYEQAMQYGFDDYMTWLLESLSEQTGKSRKEVIAMISSYGNDGFITMTLKPETEYYAIAVGINENGMTCTEVVSMKFSTEEMQKSDNTFEIIISDLTNSTASVNVTATNGDPYIIAIEPVTSTRDLNGKELAEYIIQSNMAWGGLETMTFNGSTTIEHLGKAGWDYEVIVFGYNAGLTTTEISRHPFKMKDGGNPASCTFDFSQTFSTFEMILNAVPSDNSVVYISNVLPLFELELMTNIKGSREKALKTIMENLIGEMIQDCGTKERVIDLISMMGPLEYNMKYAPATEYIQWAVAVDQAGNTTADFVCSEPFKTPEEQISDASLTIKSCKWYDGAELAEVYPEMFKSAKGYAIIDLVVEASDEAVQWWSYAALEDLTDRSREVIIKNLISAPTEPCLTRQLITAYWGTNTIMGVAQDAEGIYGPLLLNVVDLSKENASPASDFNL